MGRVEYIYDPSVDDDLDWQLRILLSKCFKDPIFRVRRFNNELPGHRWVIGDEEGAPVAHAAVHDKRIGSTGGEFHVDAVAEVCIPFTGEKNMSGSFSAICTSGCAGRG